jgi:hypothetical protein
MRFPPLPCPMPKCPVQLRMVPNPHDDSVTIYHGEDVLFTIEGDGDLLTQDTLPAELEEQFTPLLIGSVAGLHSVQELMR